MHFAGKPSTYWINDDVYETDYIMAASSFLMRNDISTCNIVYKNTF